MLAFMCFLDFCSVAQKVILGYGTTLVGCKGGSRYVEGYWVKIFRFSGLSKFHRFKHVHEQVHSFSMGFSYFSKFRILNNFIFQFWNFRILQTSTISNVFPTKCGRSRSIWTHENPTSSPTKSIFLHLYFVSVGFAYVFILRASPKLYYFQLFRFQQIPRILF